MSQSDTKVKVEKDGCLLWVTFNRPAVKNAVDFDVMHLLSAAADQAETDPEIKIFILKGQEGIFCSGGDLNQFHKLKTESEAMTMLRPMSGLLKKIASLPVITVAYLNGHAVGGGCEIAAACDYRISAEHSKSGFIQGTLAITTGWGGAAFLREKVSYNTALDMLTSAKLCTAEEGLKSGWINGILNNERELSGWCGQWRAVKKQVITAYKQALRTEMEKTRLFTAIDSEVERCAVLWGQDAHHEAVDLFLSKKHDRSN
ncbi:enoyl-CoA hydratase [Alteribacter lacisalsi]|uniref:Enoyl-CoA hydratase n=1 Tax=Alteribacter lacisalsi TaxID=2045244 RepID=A0A2W0HLD7_9BACI|nr:enoyl-CoA hydratase/isomerase family protein [Alteribacter lacisalsi]PYZ97912.1 enoyl-CoA hydratase [Alteribacter lacisalsi]